MGKWAQQLQQFYLLFQAKRDADDNCSKCFEAVVRLLPIMRPLEKMPAAKINEAIRRALREINKELDNICSL